MQIRAILQHGRIQPIDRLPAEWTDGVELLISESSAADAEVRLDAPSDADLDKWLRDLEAAVERILAEDHERFMRALEEVERESKEGMRRAWGLA